MNQKTIATFDNESDSFILCKKAYHSDYILYWTITRIDKAPRHIKAKNDTEALEAFNTFIDAIYAEAR